MQSFGIYVHIPFCKRKCKYCDFISFDKCDKNLQNEYVECLVNEIENCEIKKDVDTIYFGGGTPSFISMENIEKILNKIKEKFNVFENAEITIEVNPWTVDENSLNFYKKIGINRLSIGLQSTDDRILELIGRIHKYNDFLNVYNLARKIGFKNINVDLMLGIPTQTLDDILKSVNEVIELNPEHISLYSLILEDGTELEGLVSKGELNLPSEQIEREMYWKTKNILEKNGYNHYEISNFAKKGCESKHNVNCWNQEEYIGFGLSAHSYVDKKRFCNISNLENYIKNIENEEFEKNVIIDEEQDALSQMKEYIMIGLRKIDGISISKFEQKFSENPIMYFKHEINKLEKKDLIEVDLDNIKLTKKGLDFANIVFEEFI